MAKGNGFVAASASHGFLTCEVEDGDGGRVKNVQFLNNPLNNEDPERTGGGPHPPTEKFNDGHCSPDGRFFAGTFQRNF